MWAMPLEFPRSLAWVAAARGGRDWLGSLPHMVEECVEEWHLVVGAPLPGSHVSLVMPAVREDGTRAVLKLNFPHRESEHEGTALAAWEGEGAVRLFAEDRRRRALLMERCVPGTPLSVIPPDDAVEVLAGLLPRLWKPASTPPFRSLADEAAWWRNSMRQAWTEAGRPLEARLIDAALDILASLPGTQGAQVLLHQDLHGGNVLAAEREPWLVIDPKPLCGEREFGLAPIIRSAELGHSRAAVRRRLDRLSAELGVDRERARLWCIAQTVAWSIGGESPPHLHDVARWLLKM